MSQHHGVAKSRTQWATKHAAPNLAGHKSRVEERRAGEQMPVKMLYFCVCVHVCLVAQSCPTLCDPVDCGPPVSVHGDSPDKNTRMGCHALLQGIFPSRGSNPGLPHCRRILYHLSHLYSSQMQDFSKCGLSPATSSSPENLLEMPILDTAPDLLNQNPHGWNETIFEF